MNVYVGGRVRNKKLVYTYVGMLLKILKIDRLNRDLEIQFITECDGRVLGFCWGDSDEVTIQISREHYDRKLSFIEMMQTLAHEMVHARQFLRGELVAEGVWKWKGRNGADYKYENQPWEKEAYRLEKVLFQDCFPFHIKFTN